jgi:HAD superfamily hydrolase (TIGR01662 family)
MSSPRTTIVIPTVGRPSLATLLDALAHGSRTLDAPVIVVDDRPEGGRLEALVATNGPGVRVVRSGGGGPARARNLGWRLASTEWVSFLDDDVVPDHDWYERLLEDLRAVGGDVAGTEGRVRVPLPADRRPTDWERSTSGLAEATWITADLTYRRSALRAVGGFDERFPRAFREDADLGLRISSGQGRIVVGDRWVTHPVRPAGPWVSLRQQAGNADDMLMVRLHGRSWRERTHAPRGRRRRHLATALSGAAALAAAGTLHRRTATGAGLVWLGLTAELTVSRIAPGPRTTDEVARMTLTSLAIPFAATWHTLRGLWRHRAARPWRGLPDLVLFDRDGTLVHDVPYNGDPELVRPVATARPAVDRLRQTGVLVGVVTNQSGVAAGVVSLDQVQAVNERVEKLLGPFSTWQVCPHARDQGCTCRKPAPGMVKSACAELGVDPARTVVVGDIASDVEAAEAAGARGILVPTPATRVSEVRAAERVHPDLGSAVDAILEGRW